MPEANIDVAINIFAKPLRTSLAVLSLLARSGAHINKLWLQYEPMATQYDHVGPYCIFEYVKEKGLITCEASQPDLWMAREAADMGRIDDAAYRRGIRYQHAFEHSRMPLLFIMHNDVYILKDILGAMRAQLGDAFAIGQLGQCWNCPAAKEEIAQKVMGRGACKPDAYQDFRPDHAQLCQLYAEARENQIFARPYDKYGFQGEFAAQPWPLPECRINEWACLIDLEKVRPLTMPFGSAFPPGGYRPCADLNLDIAVGWFRDLHAKGLHAKNFDVKPWLKHWVGTGNNTPVRYLKAEANAASILKKHFPDYVAWLERRYQTRI